MKTNVFVILLTSWCFYPILAWADQSNHVGARVMNKEEIITMLQPKILTRGINMNPSQNSDYEQSISMEIQFKFNSVELSQHAIAQLAPLGAALKSNELTGLSFILEGHTDASGSEKYNMSLSQRRAQSVSNYLRQSHEVDPSYLQVAGKGETDLLDWNNPTSGVNRRVAITTLLN